VFHELVNSGGLPRVFKYHLSEDATMTL